MELICARHYLTEEVEIPGEVMVGGAVVCKPCATELFTDMFRASGPESASRPDPASKLQVVDGIVRG